jgi:hypothetical protein
MNPVLRRGFVLLALAFCLTACGGASVQVARERPAGPSCPKAWKAGWQALANRIQAPVYCPSWITPPLTGELRGRWNNIYSVDRRDRSYLVGFTWYEVGSGEVHVNFRGYPETTEIPRCPGDAGNETVPCFSDASGKKRIGGREVRVYTANQGADKWHVLYAWKESGALYAVSEHVAEPYTSGQVVRYLDRIMRGLARIEPDTA